LLPPPPSPNKLPIISEEVCALCRGGDGEPSTLMAGCCVFLLPRRPSSLGYRSLTADEVGDTSSATVTVVVGKEMREFLVDPVVLEKDLFRVLLAVARWRKGGRGEGGKKRKRGGVGVKAFDQEPIFVDVDAILFEHLLWLASNSGGEGGRGGPALLQPDLEEIIEFYAQDY
ncbi:hypothetical protein Taro_012583, partial [Colocasia esculenta]|nr:hypothetical protein [Colocasia esculenta]